MTKALCPPPRWARAFPTPTASGWPPGVEYRFSPGSALNLSYGHLFNDDGTVALTQAQTGNALRGNLSGTTRSAVDTIGLQFTGAL